MSTIHTFTAIIQHTDEGGFRLEAAQGQGVDRGRRISRHIGTYGDEIQVTVEAPPELSVASK